MNEVKTEPEELINREFAAEFKTGTTVEQLIACAKKYNIELTEEQAAIHLSHLQELRGEC